VRTTICLLALAVAALGESAAGAEVDVQFNVNRDDQATGEFKFEKTPAPSRTDAANGAKFSVVAGRRDRNGGELAVLNDGRLPGESDEPGANFFFAAGSDGGRLLVDLGQAVDLQQVNTYSWHVGERGPQVYKLYAEDPAAKEFDPAGARSGDPASAGWQLLAEVDTRAEGEPTGGQYGVSISGAEALGKRRYLLFDVAKTTDDGPFGQTFFSEIDVLDGKEHPAPAAPAEPATVVDVLRIGDEYEIEFDLTEAPEDVRAWVEKTLKPACAEWYPKIVEMLPSDRYTAPTRFKVIFDAGDRGVAYTGGTEVHCAVPWFEQNLEGEATGAVIHELVHVVQQYGRARGRNRNPGWMVEGVADYIRWFLFEPEDQRPRPNPRRAHYTDSYRTTAAFLNYVLHEHDEKLVEKFNAAMRRGEYSEDLWKEYTGKTVDQLWDDYVKTLESDE
jgi:hypothetical protein